MTSARSPAAVGFAALVLAAAALGQGGLAPADSPLRAPQEAILRGDRDAARTELDRLPAAPSADADVAARAALLRAAAEPAERRLDAFLAFAEKSLNRPEADVALVAAAAHFVRPERFDAPVLPPAQADDRARADGAPDDSDAWTLDVDALAPSDDDGEDGAGRPRRRARFHAALTAREAAPNADAALLARARADFERATTVDCGFRRVLSTAVPRMPGPLAARVHLVVRRLEGDAVHDAEAAPAAGPPALVRAFEPGSPPVDLAAPPPGIYDVLLTSDDGTRRARRRLLVSDLDLVVVAYPEVAFVAARRGGAPWEGATVRVDGGGDRGRAVSTPSPEPHVAAATTTVGPDGFAILTL
ncbi:MAG TPA: hypothetical protein VEI02_13830, partial [Planctomycetota bacterium]|nr:hypothetical protein [Planctomycetota bacterium]